MALAKLAHFLLTLLRAAASNAKYVISLNYEYLKLFPRFLGNTSSSRKVNKLMCFFCQAGHLTAVISWRGLKFLLESVKRNFLLFKSGAGRKIDKLMFVCQAGHVTAVISWGGLKFLLESVRRYFLFSKSGAGRKVDKLMVFAKQDMLLQVAKSEYIMFTQTQINGVKCTYSHLEMLINNFL